MLRLILLRHGKSDWGASYERDHDRPLAPRGRRGAKSVGRFLARSGREPDRVLTSTARRAHDTVVIAARAGRWRAPIETTDVLYGASPESALETARRHALEEGMGPGSLLIAGHEPTFSELAGRLIGGARVAFPTAAVASIRFAGDDWGCVDFGRGELEFLLKPKLLERFLEDSG